MNKRACALLLIIFILGFSPLEILAVPTITGNASDTLIGVGRTVNIFSIVSYSSELSGARVDWGDGMIEGVSCDIGSGGGSCSITASHSYDSEGSYRIYVGAGPAHDHRWTRIDTVQITADHCLNGAQDADEEGVDCGGTDCPPCVSGPVIPGPATPDSYDNPLLAENIPQFIWQMIILLFTVSLYLAPLMIIIGAYVIVTSGGIPSKVDRGKRIIVWTLVAFSIILISRGIIHLVWMLLGG